jgi:dipeptidase E
MRKLLLLSCSTLYGSGYLEYARDYIIEFFVKNNSVSEILFIPYAGVGNQDKYTLKVKQEMEKWGLKITGINDLPDPVAAVNNAQGIFIGGGNTFHLLKTLQDKKLIEPIRNRVFNDGVPYMGSSAGSNVATRSIHTTNDMPICHVESLESLALVPFNINPHYIDPDPNSTHQGETRESRINEFHAVGENMPPVLGLREGSYLHVRGDVATLGGVHQSRLFTQGENAKEYPCGSDMSFLLN